MEPSTFETLIPSRYITFSFPNPLQPHHHLRLAVLDSPSSSAAAEIAVVWVPTGRESDWIFSTHSGHLHLLLSSSTTISRLILVGKSPLYPHPTSYNSTRHPSSVSKPLQQQLTPLLLALTPKSCFGGNCEIPDIPSLVYEDGVVRIGILEICEGPFVGEMLVENVELETHGDGGDVKEYRRRLRFKRMPNLVQTQMKIRPKNELGCEEELDDMEFELDDQLLVHPYLSPMVAGISVISSVLEKRIRQGFTPNALCLGVGGGALLGFLNCRLGFQVVGVEQDEVVLAVARRHFRLENNESIHLCVGDGIDFVKKLTKKDDLDNKFDVIMVDLDSSDCNLGVCAPPVEFVRKSVLRAAREILNNQGVLVINTIPSRKSFYENLVSDFQVVFEELYEIDVGNGENLVLTASKGKVENALDTMENTFLDKLRSVVPTSFLDNIKKISKNDGPQFHR